MQVVEATRFGGPEVLAISEAPHPVAGPGQVVVDVSVADTLFLDTVIRRGEGGGQWSVRPPYVPGAGVAGQVTSVGERVDEGWVGRRVVVKSGAGGPRPDVENIAEAALRTTPTGGYAEQAVAREQALVPVPDGLDLCQAAALINDGLTAILLTETTQLQLGEWVLVTPAGGGLGSLLVQLAHVAGARVVAACGQRKLDLASELGAETVVDYSRPDWPERVLGATGGTGPDVVLDGVGGQIGRASFELTARGGRFVAFGAPGGGFTMIDEQQAHQHGVTATSLLELQWTPADEKRLPQRALSEAVSGRIRPVIGQTFPLEKAADAHAAIEARSVVGKTLLLT